MRAHAFICYMKLCLRREALAKKSMPLFIVFLTADDEVLSVRSNILLGLGELTVSYTSVVDRFVPTLAQFLQDGNRFLRKTAVFVLSSLLAEDFVKPRRVLIFPLLSLVVDPDESIKNLVQVFFMRILEPRNPNLYKQSFVEIICSLHQLKQPEFTAHDTGIRPMSLLDRCAIYEFVLGRMKKENKFICSAL